MTNENKEKAKENFQLKKRFCRASALQLLYQMDLGDEWELTDAVFELFWKQLEEDAQIPPFNGSPGKLKKDVKRLTSGVLDKREDLDEKITSVTKKWPLPRMNIIDRNILRLGLFEILFSEKTPRKVAINEAIELAREYGDKESPAFINGLLDRF